MFEKIYNILVDFLGESKQGYYSKDVMQYQFNCPCCREENGGIPDGKFNLEVNFGIGKFHCWKCSETDGTKGNISFLIRRYGSRSLYREYKDEIVRLKKVALYDIDAFSGVTFDKIEIEPLSLPKTYQSLVLSECRNKKLVEYLNRRKIDQKIIDKFRIGYTGWDNEEPKWRNRIIIPSYDKFGDLNYFVGRDFSGKAKAKYRNCDAEKLDIVFQEGEINYDADICLVEGAIDCIYGPNTIALLGKSLSKDSILYQTLYKKANGRIIICLDADTDINETKKIYSLLNFGRLSNKIWYIRMNEYKDFGEAYENGQKSAIINLLKQAKQFEEIDLLI